jgi:cation-transporting P-type ATPase E
MTTTVSSTQAPPRAAEPQPTAGLSEAEAQARLSERGRSSGPASSRSYRSIVRANVLTVFNLILAVFGGLTLAFADWRDALFLGVILANSTIGVVQEVRAKRALDRLALLVAPRAHAVRDGRPQEIGVAEVVPGDLLRLGPGDQIVADGRLTQSVELRLDESVLTGESRTVARGANEQIRSGAFVAEGSGAYVVEAVGQDSFAAKVVGEARAFRHPRSPLERAVNRLLYGLVALMVGLGAVLGYSLYHRHVGLHEAVSTSVAGVVSLVPEGLMVLVSLTYAVASVRMARRGVLAQQLNAIESLASVEVLCVDKTGTLTEAALRVAAIEPADGVEQRRMADALARLSASASAKNGTLQAIADAFPGEAESPRAEVPFSSRRRFSAASFAQESLVLGAPERFERELGPLAERARRLASEGRRVVALLAGPAFPGDASAGMGGGGDGAPNARERREDAPPAGLRPLGLVVLGEQLRPNVAETISFLLAQDVEVKVLSGDSPATAAAIARDVGIPVAGVLDWSEVERGAGSLPGGVPAAALSASVVGRISPEGKRAVVEALRDSGRYVAMLGDGVNDVPALKRARLAIAQGSGAQMARSVADLVLVSGDFDVVPALVEEGRKALRNLQRVTKLYVTKSSFAAFLILTIGTSSEAYPLLPRHLSLAAAVTIGVPTFFLALAPSSGEWRPQGFVRRVARFAVPAGAIVGTGILAGYLFATHDLDYSVAAARTIAETVLVAVGLYLVLSLESGGSLRRSGIVGTMCLALAGAYVVVLLVPSLRSFFQLAPFDAGMLATALVAAGVSIGALALAGYGLVSRDHD